MKIGLVGYNEGNGHPFSFSSIINGYNDEAYAGTDYAVIRSYLNKQPKENFGFRDVLVTHVWTPFQSISKQISNASRIENICHLPGDMLGKVDAIIIATDNSEDHLPLARPFLEYGLPVFIDKPLTLDLEELDFFIKYIETGHLMTTSGLRYAVELDSVRNFIPSKFGFKHINGVVINEFERYGIHLLDAVSGLNIGNFEKLTRLPTNHSAYLIHLNSGIQFILSCIVGITKTFHLSFYGESENLQINIQDNFTAFRRTLGLFINMVKNQIPPILPEEIYRILYLLLHASKLKVGESISYE